MYSFVCVALFFLTLGIWIGTYYGTWLIKLEKEKFGTSTKPEYDEIKICEEPDKKNKKS